MVNHAAAHYLKLVGELRLTEHNPLASLAPFDLFPGQDLVHHPSIAATEFSS
jgi:hypothetical protein